MLRIGLALTQYSTAKNAYPSGTVINPELPTEKRLSFLPVIVEGISGGFGVLIDLKESWDAESL